MYNYLVKYSALFALSYVFGKTTCLYIECSKWRSTRTHRGESSVFITGICKEAF